MNAGADFGMLPPEINSARIYLGAGVEPLSIAASAWKSLAAELHSAAITYGAVIAALSDDDWRGPASTRMTEAATPYVEWLNATAEQAERTAQQAESAAAAYQAAYASTVPPAQVTANRARIAALTATNLVGQHSAAIAAAEAQYCEMWAQDTVAMCVYANASASATEVDPFANPPSIIDTTGLSEQLTAVTEAATTETSAGQSGLSRLIDSVPTELRRLASPASAGLSAEGTDLEEVWNPFVAGSAYHTTGLNGLLHGFFGADTSFGQFANANIWNTAAGSGFFLPSNFFGTAADYIGMSQGGTAVADAAAEAATSAVTATESAVDAVSTAGAFQASGAVGQAITVSTGALSVPASWAATPNIPMSALPGATPMLAAPASISGGIAGLPTGNTGGRGYARQIPTYGSKPHFVTRPPAAG